MSKKIISVLLILCLLACHKDAEEETTTTKVTKHASESTAFLETALDCYVFDITQNPIPNAIIEVLGTVTQTDEMGYCRIPKILLDPLGTVLNVSKVGFQRSVVSIVPHNLGTVAKIQMQPIRTDLVYSSSSNVEIALSNSTIQVPKESVLNQDGTSHVGNVRFQFNTFETVRAIHHNVPSLRFAQAKDAPTQLLSFHYVYRFDLLDSSNNPLLLDNGSSATVTIDINSGNVELPSDATLWYYNGIASLWEKVIDISAKDSKYILPLIKTGYYAIAEASDFIQVDVDMKANNVKAAYHSFEFQTTSQSFSGLGYFNMQGFMNTFLPKSVPGSILISEPFCGDVIMQQTNQIFDQSEKIELIDSNVSVEAVTLSGSCNGNLISDFQYVIQRQNTFWVYPIGESNALIPLSLLGCFDDPIKVWGRSVTENVVSDVQTIQLTNPYILNPIDLCSNCDFGVVLKDKIVDPCNSEGIAIEAEITGGSGNFAFKWSTNETTKSIEVTASKTYCVTVTDQDEHCSSSTCIDVQAYSPLSIDYILKDASCGKNNGSIHVTPKNGKAPYIIKVLNTNYSKYGDIHENLEPEYYSIIVEDAGGCKKQVEVQILNSNSLDVEFKNFYACLGGQTDLGVDIKSGKAPYTYKWSNTATTETISVYAGTYCVTIKDAEMCEFTDCKNVENYQIQGTYYVSCDGTDYIGKSTNMTESFEYLSGGKINDYAKEQYVLRGNAIYEGMQCKYYIEMDLPHFEGLTAEAKHTSCVGCDDGAVTFNIDELATCVDCLIDDYTLGIFDINDLDNNLIGQNNTLGKGFYYAVVFSKDGCVIASKSVEIL